MGDSYQNELSYNAHCPWMITFFGRCLITTQLLLIFVSELNDRWFLTIDDCQIRNCQARLERDTNGRFENKLNLLFIWPFLRRPAIRRGMYSYTQTSQNRYPTRLWSAIKTPRFWTQLSTHLLCCRQPHQQRHQSDVASPLKDGGGAGVIQFPRQSQFKRINAVSDFFAFTKDLE